MPQVILEYLEEHNLCPKELLILEVVIKDTLKCQRLTQALKTILKELKKRVETSIKLKNENEEDKKKFEETDINPELDQLELLIEESFHRYDLFVNASKNIKTTSLINPKIPVATKVRPRFTDMYQVNNEANEEDDSNLDFLLADNEDLYYQQYSEYVRNSIRKTNLGTAAPRSARTAVKKQKGRKETPLKAIVEEESSHSEMSSLGKFSAQRLESPRAETVKGEDSKEVEFEKYVVKGSKNKNISKMREDMYQLSQYINTKERMERGER